MKLDVRFDNLDEIKQYYDPVVVEKAAYATVQQLHRRAATEVKRAVTREYSIKQRDITASLKKRVVRQNGVPVGFLVYTSRRLSLRRFTGYKSGTPSTRVRPKVKSARGRRRGARVKVMKRRPSRIVNGAFWGRGRAGKDDAAGEWHIFKRIGMGRNPVKKLTGPSIAHMVRNDSAIEEINRIMEGEAADKLANNLDHFMKRRIGIR